MEDFVVGILPDDNPISEIMKSGYNYGFDTGYRAGFESAQPKWISVVDELPKKWRENDAEQTLVNYQIYSPKYGVDIGNYLKPAGRWVIMGLPVDDVTHWMPLPEAPGRD